MQISGKNIPLEERLVQRPVPTCSLNRSGVSVAAAECLEGEESRWKIVVRNKISVAKENHGKNFTFALKEMRDF